MRGGQCRKSQRQEQKDRVGCAPSKEGRSVAAPPPALRPSTRPALGSSPRAPPSLASRISRPGPRDGRVSIHPCSQQTGVPGLPGVLHREVRGPHLPALRPWDSGSFLPKTHVLFSMQLAKFSEDTLSSYTEAVSSQVPSPGWMLALYPQPELPQAPSGTPGCPCIMALSFPLRAPLAPVPCG